MAWELILENVDLGVEMASIGRERSPVVSSTHNLYYKLKLIELL